jgi:acetoin utilization deacetylase AcuC-like enzyme
VLKVHDFRYINNVIKKCEMIADDELGRYDRDSTISCETWKAALLSCGTVIDACDKIMSSNGEVHNAFCAIRPPGHHAGVFGKTFKKNVCDQEQTNGFCYINNVAVAAAYLKNVYRKQIKKVAIIDFDVHHGNGTQEIVQCM